VRAAGVFDPTWYLEQYPDVARGRLDPLWHFASRGSAQGRDPNPMFDTRWYKSTYPDVVEIGVDPLVHFVDHGAAEGRDPSPRFDTRFYLRSNPDVRTAGLNPLGHYLAAGQAEGRRCVPVTRIGGRRQINAVIVSGEPGTPGHEYRVARLAGALSALGHVASVRTVPEAALQYASEVGRASLIVLWRCVWGPEVERVVTRARRAGAVVVFDVDDLMTEPRFGVGAVVDGIRSQGLTESEAQHWFAKMRRTAEESGACLCTTEPLASQLRQLGKPTWVIPNGYDDAAMSRSQLATRTRRLARHDGLVRIGYAAGSLTHQRDFAQVAPAVAAVLRSTPRARLVVFRGALKLAEFPEFDDLADQVEWRDVVALPDLPSELARFDINLAPLEVGNPFCEAKSPLKVFEAALVEVPTIASPTEPFRAAIEHGVTGFLAADDDAWRDCLHRLVGDVPLRRDIGRAALAAMRWPYGPDRRRQLVAAVLDQVLDDGPAAAAAFALESSRVAQRPSNAPRVCAATVIFERDCLRCADVTVVIPVHNYARFVVDALESVREQTLDALDLIVVDDASTDDSLAVTRRWMEEHAVRFTRCVLLSLADNAGLAAARNTGFDAATTPYVLPLDADNALLPECATRLLNALSTGAASFAYPRIRHFGEESDLFPTGHVRGYFPYSAQRLVPSNYIDAMALVRKNAWAAVGGYHDGLHGWEDYDLWCRLAEAGFFGVQVADDLALYRVHGESMLHAVTHVGTRLEDVRQTISDAHPWLRLEDKPESAVGSTTPVPRPIPYVRTPPRDEDPPQQLGDIGRLSPRARDILPLLRCPVTREPLEEAPDGGLRSAATGRRWPALAGRPVLAPQAGQPRIVPTDHVGNPLPARARGLMAQTSGLVLHLSGGGTAANHDHAIELDADVFGPTDVVGDVHALPFDDATFDLVIVMNAFEHYREPELAVREIRRVLTPGGLVFLHTAFLQPVHEAPHHYFNCTRHGLEQWFREFETVDLNVPDNLHPGFSLAWLASDAQEALEDELSAEAAASLGDTSISALAAFWRDPANRENAPVWEALARLSGQRRERLAAGFEFLGRVEKRHGVDAADASRLA
jgi:glycosyltransferase involved in cell wall biosynthesis/SAM-dependent methyltransferase